MLYSLLALLPILVLVTLSLWKNLNIAVIISFLVTAGLFFLWGSPANHFFASLITALFSSIIILIIVFGAMFLYRVMEGTGYISDISASISLGNSICLFYIIAAATVANVSNYKQILKDNLLPTIAAGLVAAIVGWLLVQVWP